MDERKIKHIKHLVDIMDEDIPVVENHKTIKEQEIKNGCGFWGNATTGYIYNDDL